VRPHNGPPKPLLRKLVCPHLGLVKSLHDWTLTSWDHFELCAGALAATLRTAVHTTTAVLVFFTTGQYLHDTHIRMTTHIRDLADRMDAACTQSVCQLIQRCARLTVLPSLNSFEIGVSSRMVVSTRWTLTSGSSNFVQEYKALPAPAYRHPRRPSRGHISLKTGRSLHDTTYTDG
jgi:hypothetical protein